MKSILASDYACIWDDDLSHSSRVRLYYGYEVEMNGEWCFQAKCGSETHTIPFSKLGGRDREDCGENLLLGIAKLFDCGELKLEIKL